MTQAKDIDDAAFLAEVDRLSHTSWLAPDLVVEQTRWVQRWDLEHLGPPRVVLAKARKLIKRGLLGGCPCGCRGDFELTASGRAYLAGADR